VTIIKTTSNSVFGGFTSALGILQLIYSVVGNIIKMDIFVGLE